MKILYVHGYGSNYDPTNEKVVSLATMGDVFGITIDYTDGYDTVYKNVQQAVYDNDIDLIVGTSMGGYMSANIGAALGIPFVAINPAIEPSVSLQQIIGEHTTYSGKEVNLTKEAVQSLPYISLDGFGLVLLDSADDVIDPYITEDVMKKNNVVMFDGGSHRFSHIDESLILIAKHFILAKICYN